MIEHTTNPKLGRRSFGLLAPVGIILTLIFAPAAAAATGNLIPKPGVEGCISENGTGGACTDGKGLGLANSVALSPDGKNVYVTSGDPSDADLPGIIYNAITIFDRDPATGKLTQKAGLDGCISETGNGGACTDGKALAGASSVTVSPDGKSVYVKSTIANAVAIFDRDPATGKLTQKTGSDGCVSQDGFDSPIGTAGACADGKALIMVSGTDLDSDRSIVVSPDGKTLYVAAPASFAVAVFDRDPATGKLTQKAGLDGCYQGGTNDADVCTDVIGLQVPTALAISPAGDTLYVMALTPSIATFDRDSATGKLTYKPAFDHLNCIIPGLNPPLIEGLCELTVSSDGLTVFTASSGTPPEGGSPDPGVGSRDRDPATGELTQKDLPLGPGDDAYPCVGATVNCDHTGIALATAESVAASPDAKSVYVASRAYIQWCLFSCNYSRVDAVAILDYSRTSGKLAQKVGKQACIGQDATFFCTQGRGLAGATSVAVSPDGQNVYVASRGANTANGPGALAIFDRDPDGIAPTTAIDSGPSGTTNDPRPAFAFSASEAGSTFECNLDAEGFLPCSSPKSYPKFTLDEGPHTFSVRATDTDLNTGATITRSFTVDRTVDGTASAAKTQKQKGKRIVVEARIEANESLEAEASGSIKAGRSSFKLKPVTDAVPSTGSAALRLMPAKSGDAKKIAASLKKSKVTASIDVTLTDDAGNSNKSKLSVALKG